MKITPDQLRQEITAFVDSSLASQLVDSYTKMQQRYYIGDWQPSELDGGQFCEAVARAIYQSDTGIVDHALLPGEISTRLKNNSLSHILNNKDRDHFCKVLQTTYKFRNDRGVAHVSSTYTANYVDATLIVSNVKWMFVEFLRLSWKKDRNEIASIIETITQLEHPLIHELDGQPLVLSNNLNTSEEILILLQHSSSGRLNRSELRQWVRKDQSMVNRSITRLVSEKEVRISSTGDIVITYSGQKRVHEDIMPKLSSNNSKK